MEDKYEIYSSPSEGDDPKFTAIVEDYRKHIGDPPREGSLLRRYGRMAMDLNMYYSDKRMKAMGISP